MSYPIFGQGSRMFKPGIPLLFDRLRSIRSAQAAALSRLYTPGYFQLKSAIARVDIPRPVMQQAKQKADAMLKEAQRTASGQRTPAQQVQINAHVTQLRAELIKSKQALATRAFRTPAQITSGVLKRSQTAFKSSRSTMPGGRTRSGTIPGKLIVYTQPIKLTEFEKAIADALTIPANQKLADYGIKVDTFFKELASDRLFVIRFPFSYLSARKDLWNLASVLRKTPGFISVQPERVRAITFSAVDLDSDPNFSRNVRWHLAEIKVPQALQVPISTPHGKQQGAGVVIGHPDTGWREHGQYVRKNESHVDFARSCNVITGRVGGKHAEHGTPPSYNPNVCHGTATACLMVSQDNSSSALATSVNNSHPGFGTVATNPVDIVGVAPKARVLPIKCVDDVTGVVRIADEHLARAIEYATMTGVDVISISLGGAMHPAVEVAIREAIRRNIIVIAAAGQSLHILNTIDMRDSVSEPASFPDVIAVAGSTKNHRPWDQTHNGPSVDITAPAHGIWVADFDDKGTEIVLAGSGTSFSAALTAGVAGLWIAFWGKKHLLAMYPNVPLARVFRHLLRRTANNIGGKWDTNRFGAGIINAEALLKEPLPPESSIPGPDINQGNLISSIGDGIGVISDTMDMLEELAKESIDTAEDVARLTGYLVKATADAVVERMQTECENLLAVVSVTTGQLQQQAQRALQEAEQALDEAVQAAEEATEAVAEMTEDAIEAVTETVEAVADTVGEAAEDVVNWFNSLY